MNWEESDYRKKVQETLSHIEKAFSNVDPDVAECEISMGSLTVTLSDRSKLILSQQPSVRQIWLALAAKGTAFHFNYDSRTGQWLDDKGKGVELLSFVREFFRSSCELNLAIGIKSGS